ncbi:MAG: biosynthetic-type acetolactate synthase large subunit [Cyclobacteriaceae bacterium]|nr:biosynthetic-type acetolactate synthase large subunit [Cyclobacteriaceae bacterium]
MGAPSTLVSTKTNTSVALSGAEAVIKSLIQEDVDLLFGYPGGAIMPVYDALYHYQKEIKHVLTRHEQGAIHAAQGYARASGKTGVVIATSGPGATNLITGIADAQIDSTPLVCITGQVISQLLGTDGFQETDVIGISMPITKWNYQVTSAEEIPEALAKAFFIARSGRPGPVLVDITKDAQFEQFNFDYKKCESIRSYNPVPTTDQNSLKKAASLVNESKKPYIIFGQGVILSGAEQELRQLLEKTGIPAASTLLGLSALPTTHPQYVGMVGMHGNYGPNLLTNECDTLIAVGMRFDDRVTGDLKRYCKQAKIIHIEVDPSEIDKNVKCDIPLLGDAKKILQSLLPLVNKSTHPIWMNEFEKCKKIEFEKVVQKDFFPKKDQLSMGEVLNEINNITKGDSVVVSDVGQHQMISCRYAQFNYSRSNITSGGLGTMGFCLPAAIGAKLAQPLRQVIAIVGDGGFQMTLQELGTIKQFGIDIKIIILNNEFLGMVRQWQELFFEKRYAHTEMQNPDFIAIAKGYGIEAKKITEREGLNDALKKMLTHNGSYLLEVRVGKEGNVFPMVATGASVSEVRLE